MTTHINLGQAPGLNTPIEKAPEACDSKGLNENTTTNDFATKKAQSAKAATTLIAKFALAGHAVHRLESGFLVCRWGQTRHCPDLDALINFGRVLGVTQ